jgi:hypothetical protein
MFYHYEGNNYDTQTLVYQQVPSLFIVVRHIAQQIANAKAKIVDHLECHD